LMIPRLQV